MRIAVKNRDYGFFSAQPITVYRMDDSGIVWCNHDGCFEDDFDHDIIHNDDTITTVWDTYEVCDKCYAHRLLGDEEWIDAPARI